MSQPPGSPKKRTTRTAADAPAVGGDSISGTIGDNARGAAIGKNIFQNIIVIGTLKIPVLPVLVLIFLVLAVAAFFGLRLLGPAKMTGTFNLAVAEFGQVDASGKVTSSALGSQISQRLFQGLKVELDSLSPADRANFQPQVWQDSLDITQKRVQIGVIPGDTPLARWTAACSLAEKINASVMIYGNIPPGSGSEAFIPEFAVCDNPSLRLNADEIVGPHQLLGGLPLQLLSQLGQPNTDLAVNMQINSWTGVLSLFSIGIMYDLQGRPDLALATFQKARDQLGASPGAAAEVLWFFIGRAELTLSNPAGLGQDSAQDRAVHLANAQAAFQQSLKLNPAYARAHLGLGSVYFSRAQDLPSQDRLTTGDLAGAIDQYQQALAASSSSAGALIGTKADLGLASTWILQGEAQRDGGQLDQASGSFARAVQAASGALQPLIDAQEYRLLAQAYLTLGEAYQEQGHLALLQGDDDAGRKAFANASANYALCIRQKDAAITDQTLAEKIVANYCIPYKQSADDSLAALK